MELNKSIELFNNPIIKDKDYILQSHKIFQKYSSPKYRKYSFELIETLCKRSPFENKSKILHKSIYFLLKFLFKSGNSVLIANYDLIVLISFYLGVITVANQNKIPNFTKLKKIYQEKYGPYPNEELKNAEIIFIKLLNYNINFMTAYDYLCYLFHDKIELILLYKMNLETIIKEKIEIFCTSPPLSLIKECINKIESNTLLNYPRMPKRKPIEEKRYSRQFDFHSKNLEDSLSTSISSGYFNNRSYHKYNQNYNEMRKNSPIKKIVNKYFDIDIDIRAARADMSVDKNKFCFSRGKVINNDNKTIMNKESEQFGYTYNKKNVKIFKHFKKNEKLINYTDLKNKINRKDKFRRNVFPAYDKLNLKYVNSGLKTTIINNNENYLYSKPYFKKAESKGCFTSNKKIENEVKSNGYNKYNKRETDYSLRYNLKKKLIFDEENGSVNFHL